MSRLWFVLLAVGMIPVASSHAQQLDPSLLSSGNESERIGWRPDFGEAPNARYAVEFAFGLNGYSWQAVDYEESDAIVRQTVERTRPDLSSQQLNNTLWDMQYNNVLNTFRNASGSQYGLSPRLLRVRYQPVEELPVDVSLGFGRSVGLFFAKAQLQATGSTIGLNQTDLIATSFTDHYFHLREIYANGFIEQPQVAEIWKPMFVEIGAGYQATPLVKFYGAFAFIPAAEQNAIDWQAGIREPNVASSITEIEQVLVSQQFALGCQLRLGSVSFGLEQRWLGFIGDTREYTNLGASNLDAPSYLCMSLGYLW